MYIRLTNGNPTSYSIAYLRRDNPQVSFPENISVDILAEYNVYPLRLTASPTYDPLTQNITEGVAEKQGEEWVQVWIVTEASAEEIAERQEQHTAQVEAKRAEAYRTESDPLFFKSQRGEATHQEWLDKVAEIKSRYST